MFKSLTVVNDVGDSMILGLGDPYETGLLITNIDGLGPVKGNINTTSISSRDGVYFNSARMDSRNIVVDMVLRMVTGKSIEDVRLTSYKIFPVKKMVKLIIETDNNIVYTEGYVESNQPTIFSKQETTRVSIVCPDPYFYLLQDNTTVFNGIADYFEFPFGAEYKEPFVNRSVLVPTLDNAKYLHDGMYFYSNKENEVNAYGSAGYHCFSLTESTAVGKFRLYEKGRYTIYTNGRSRGFYGCMYTSEDGVNPTTEYPKSMLKYELYGSDSYVYELILDEDTYVAFCIGAYLAASIPESEATKISIEVEHGDAKVLELGIISNYTESNVYYDGDDNIGFNIFINAVGPIRHIAIYNTRSRDYMRIDTDKLATITGQPIKAGDEIQISTVKGNKHVYLLRDGDYTNILNCLTRDSVWLELSKGDNLIAYIAEEGIENIHFKVTNEVLFEGV